MLDPFDSKVRAFLQAYISSVAKLELLLLLQRQPARSLSAESAARELGLSCEMAAVLLRELCQERLASPEPDNSFRFAPANAATEEVVGRIALLYQERRVTLIQLIYAAPVDRLRSFADAFDLRKKKEEH